MDLSRIFDETYCNEVLNKSDSKKETKRQIQLAQMFTAIKKIMTTDHFNYCLKKLTIFEEVDELPFFYGEDTHEEILSKLQESILYHEQKLTTMFFFLFENMNDLDCSQVNTLTKAVKTAIKTFIDERDELCTKAFHQLEFLIESKRLEKLLYYTIV